MDDNTLFLLKIGELALKGGNRKFFEKTLRENIRKALKGCQPRVYGGFGRFFLSIPKTYENEALEALRKCFGLTSYVKCTQVEKSIEGIKQGVLSIAGECLKTYGTKFKIESRRTDKAFEASSYELNCLAGDWILQAYPQANVDVHDPEWKINIEVREQVYVYGPTNPGPGGLPVGVAGKGILLLSGGIDSPVAGYMMAKRGLALEGLYFHAYPYTSDEALDKVKSLAGLVGNYSNEMKLHVVNFTDLQIALKERAPENELTLHMRAAMMTVAHRLCGIRDGLALVTGESLSQVASQTAQSLRVTNSYTDYPVFRPLIGLDKEEIIRIAKNIGTFETSILPYEDCCTLFSPKNPKVRPHFDETRQHFDRLELGSLLDQCVEGIQTFNL